MIGFFFLLLFMELRREKKRKIRDFRRKAKFRKDLKYTIIL